MMYPQTTQEDRERRAYLDEAARMGVEVWLDAHDLRLLGRPWQAALLREGEVISSSRYGVYRFFPPAHSEAVAA